MKQKFEHKEVISICGRVVKENDKYYIYVEQKDDVTAYPIDTILEKIEGSEVTINSDIAI